MEKLVSNEVSGLRSLSPAYVESQHGDYVRILMAELSRTTNDAPRNIALTGHYGSGKSSILSEVETRLQTSSVKSINISLPSLGIGDNRLQTSGEITLDTTNLIQKEIVKQILYRRKPSDMPASRYNRLDAFRIATAARRSAGVAFALAALALLVGLPRKVDAAFPRSFWLWLNEHVGKHTAVTLQWLSLAVVFALAFGAALWLQRVFNQRLRLTELAAGPAKVSLSDGSVSFFDEYLDEIVYYFQTSITTVVIFEDLDRFEDPHIFETLRELNLLLNNAEQTGSVPIKFVYAIRDSIFETVDSTDRFGNALPHGIDDSDEARRHKATNRTKFFDLVVPIVPFISHRTSREQINAQLQAVDADQRPRRTVVDLVSVYLTDMRLIKNICNEYDIFRRRVLPAEGLQGLTPDRLFASIVYKNVYLDDYEKIRVGESALDVLYRAYRQWVSSRATQARSEERRAQTRLNSISATAVTTRSKRLGKRLQAVLAAAGPQVPDPAHARVLHAGTAFTWPQLETAQFWQTYLASPQDMVLQYMPQQYYQSFQGPTLNFNDVQTLIGESLSQDDWISQDRNAVSRALDEARAEQGLVTHATLTDALSLTDSLFQYDNEQVSLDQAARIILSGEDTELAHQLLRAGFIDENFALYVSEFPSQGSATAMNFILKSVQPDVSDFEYHFGTTARADEAAIITVIQSEGSRLLLGQSVYNIELFDYLLANAPTKLDNAIGRLVARAGNDRSFVDAYITSGRYPGKLVGIISGIWSGVFTYLIGNSTQLARPDLVSDAILGSKPDNVAYEINEEQVRAITGAGSRLAGLSEEQSNASTDKIASLFKQFGARVTYLDQVSSKLAQRLIALDLYELTRSNLTLAVDGDANLPLDRMKEHADKPYHYALRNLNRYLSLLDSPTLIESVSSQALFTEVLVDVEKADAALLVEVANRANKQCTVDSLTEFTSRSWSAFTQARRLKLTVPLVTQYVSELGFDDDLCSYLVEAGEFVVAPNDSGRLELGLAVLSVERLDDDTKVSLLDSLELPEDSIDASAIAAPGQRLIPRLVTGNWIADDSGAYIALGPENRNIKRALVDASDAFPGYMTSLTLSANDLLDLASAESPDDVKTVLLDFYNIFEQNFGARGAASLASWAATNGRDVEIPVIVSLASKAKSQASASIIKLLSMQLEVMDIESLRSALNSLGDPYSKLTSPGHERPRVPTHPGMESILARLQRENIVSKFIERPSKSRFDVTKRHK